MKVMSWAGSPGVLRAPHVCVGSTSTRRSSWSNGVHTSPSRTAVCRTTWGGVIEHESDLLVANEQVFRGHFAVDCRPGCEAVGIDADAKTVDLRDVASGSVTTESYDTLVLAPGAPLNAQHEERTSADQLISNLGEWRVVGMARSRASSRASSRVPELRD